MKKIKIDNGGPAFPIYHSISKGDPVVHANSVHGMSLRDWFAAMTFQSTMILAIESTKAGQLKENIDEKLIAEQCYIFADAMISERKKHERTT